MKKIRASENVLVKADKTTNIYSVPPAEYNKLLHDSITKDYRKADQNAKQNIDRKGSVIARNLNLADRMEVIAERNAFITLKDHKPNFAVKPSVRLINPARDEIGVISKKLLSRINTEVRQRTKVQQWQSTQQVLDWFKNLPNRQNRKFIKFDIVSFYTSITEELLEKAITHASKFADISDEELSIIRHARHSILFSHGSAWQKKENSDFDVTMGSYDGAEVCELVGLYLLSLLTEKFGQNEVGLYRDDGLGAKASSARQADRMRKEIIKIFKDNDLEITVEILLPQTDFLDVVLDLPSGKHWPYRKPNNVPLYIHKRSNHPPQILKNLPAAINKRVSSLSCNSEVFEAAKPDYEEALSKSGFKEKMTYIEPVADDTHATQPKKKRNRKRKVIWFNPPFNVNVITNVAEKFLRMVDTLIPREYRKLFNRWNVKVSYCTMPNMAQIVQSHNAKILTPPEPPPVRTCNCTPRYGPCPLNGKCLTECVVYKATVSVPNRRDMYYHGLAGNTFKERHYGHTSDFRHESKRKSTGLSKYIWELKDEDTECDVKWEIHKKAHPYRCGSRRCDLCLSEKLAIAQAKPATSLNKRSELAKACPHQYKWKYDQASGAPV